MKTALKHKEEVNDDPVYKRGISRIQVMIGSYGMRLFMDAVLIALENIENELVNDNEEFDGSQHQKNIEHQKRVIEAAMGGVDLDTYYGHAEARKIAGERFNEDMKRLGVLL